MQLHKDRNFTLLGINAFDNAEAFGVGVEKFGVDWPVAFQGEEGAPISELYRVQGYPTIYILDGDGRIVATGLRGEALSKKVGEMLDAMESAPE